MKRALLISTLAVVAVTASFRLTAEAGGHTLVVDGVEYDSTHEAGGTIQWETAGGTPQAASFAERGQTWVYGDNGTPHLPCEFGVHWVSNDNNLVVSGCVDAPATTTTTTEAPTSTTTLAPTTTSVASSTSAPPTTTIPASSSTSPATTTTVPETTPSTSSPGTSGAPSTISSTVASTVPSPSSTPATTLPSSTSTSPTTPMTTISPKLPKTGSGGHAAPYAILALALGGLLVVVARRRIA